MNIARISLVVVLFVVVLAGCSSSPPPTLVDQGRVDYQVQTTRVDDPEEPYSIHRATIYRDETDQIDLGAIEYDDGGPGDYALAIRYTGDDWRFMDGSLLVRSGDTIFRFSEPVTRRGGYSDPVEERITVVLSEAEFEAIATGDNVALEYQPGLVVEIDDRGRRIAQQFYDDYGPQ